MGDLIKRPFATAGTRVEPPQTDQNFNVNFEQGYTPQYEIDLASGNPDAKAVERPVMNYLFWLLTSNTYDWQRKGFPQWYSSMPGGYTVGAHVTHGDVVYRSLAANNAAETTDADKWEKVLTAKEVRDADVLIRGAIPMPYGGDKGEAGAILASAIDFNEQRRTTVIIPTSAMFDQCQNRPPAIISTGGVLESLVYMLDATAMSGSQRFTTFGGEVWIRAINQHATNWTNWELEPTTKQIQNGEMIGGDLVEDSANAYSLQVSPPVKAYRKGQKFFAMVPSAFSANTGQVTINVSGLGPVPLAGGNRSNLPAGVINGNRTIEFRMISANSAEITTITGGGDTNYQGQVGALPLAAGFAHALVPVGFPMACPSNLIPENYDRMKGQAFSAAAYPELAKVYPSLKFPDMRAAAIRGLDDGRGIDMNRVLLSEQADGIRAHSHTGTADLGGDHYHTAKTVGGGEHIHNAWTDQQGNHAHNGATDTQGSHQHYSGYAENITTSPPPWGSDGSQNKQGQKDSDWDNSYWLTSPSGSHAHNFNTTFNGLHGHNIGVGTTGSSHTHNIQIDWAGAHVHSFTTNQTGGAETVMRNVAFIWVCRVK